MPQFPTHPDQVTTDWLTRILRESGALASGKVASASYTIIGTGKMGDNARFELGYEGAQPDAPDTLIAKFPAQDETARQMAGAQGAYYHEVMFYRSLAGQTEMSTPVIYANEIAEDRLSFITVMQDLAPAEPGSQLVGESLAHTQLALQEAARLATAFYGDEKLAGYDFVVSQARDDGGQLAQDFIQQSWPVFKERFGPQISAECLGFGELYASRHMRFVSCYQGPTTLIHGDFRCENILFNGDRAYVVDWQTIAESSPLADFAYFMGGSVSTEDRRSWERELVEEYREALASGGLKLSADECWQQYRAQSMHGLMITILGACFSEPAERSDAMFLAMIQRHLQHCVDLDAAEFLQD